MLTILCCKILLIKLIKGPFYVMVGKSLNFICLLKFLRYDKCLVILVKRAPKGPRKCEDNKFVKICVACELRVDWLARPDVGFTLFLYTLSCRL